MSLNHDTVHYQAKT